MPAIVGRQHHGVLRKLAELAKETMAEVAWLSVHLRLELNLLGQTSPNRALAHGTHTLAFDMPCFKD